MNSSELHNAREEARNALRQRVNAKTEKIIEDAAALRKRHRVSSESSSETIEPEEVFACQPSEPNYLWYGIVSLAVVTAYVYFFW